MVMKFLTVAIALLIVAAGLLQVINIFFGHKETIKINQQNTGPTVITSGDLEYKVGDCERSNGSFAHIAELNILLADNGDIVISQDITYVCCANITLDYVREDNTINIYERNKGSACNCTCKYHVDGKVKGMPKGAYEVKVYGIEYKEGDKVVHYLELLGKKNITIGGAQVPDGGSVLPPGCGGVMCAMYCEHGFKNDENGCPVCECNEAPGAECNQDSDCATGGCSSEVCTTAAEAPNVISTCEFKAEYNCLSLTSCGCVVSKCEWVENDAYNKCISVYGDRGEEGKEACESAGGRWGPVGLVQNPVCNMPTSDGGEECTDGGQCESRYCLADVPNATSGRCSGYTIVVGCISMVENGRVERTICID